ncbi:hypothetical protein JCM16814_28620 [Desulfobaculum senezii]
MVWARGGFALPQEAVAIHDAAGAALAGAGEASAASAGRLGVVRGRLPLTPSPVAGQAAGALALRARLAELVSVGGVCLAIHPYVHTVGDRRGVPAYLTPEAAVECLATKLADAENSPPGGALEAVGLMVCGTSHAGFRDALHTVNAVFPVTAMQMAERRAGWLVTLERDKFVRPVAPAQPEWGEQDPCRHTSVDQCARTLGARLAQVDGFDAENTRPEDELTAVMERCSARLAGQDGAWQRLLKLMQGDAGHVLHAQGSAAQIRRDVLAAPVPARGYKLTALLCWLAPPEHMRFFREMLT